MNMVTYIRYLSGYNRCESRAKIFILMVKSKGWFGVRSGDTGFLLIRGDVFRCMAVLIFFARIVEEKRDYGAGPLIRGDAYRCMAVFIFLARIVEKKRDCGGPKVSHSRTVDQR